jgi:S-disulfanyl-L-cysteine oxidoreductase SoxD
MRFTYVAATVCCVIGVSYCAIRAQENTAPPPKSVWDGAYTKEQADRGRTLYNNDCGLCHGPTLAGSDEVPGLTGGQFLSDWNGLTVGDLFDRIHNSMPADNPGSLSREVDADILAYILSANDFPAGKTELPRRSEVLALIHIDGTKPETK